MRRAKNKGISPGILFIRAVRGKALASPEFAPALARLFRILLEDMLFIPATGRPTVLILKNLKKFHRALYKSHSGRIASLLTETARWAAQSRRPSAKDEDALRDLRDRCIQLSLDAEDKAQ